MGIGKRLKKENDGEIIICWVQAKQKGKKGETSSNEVETVDELNWQGETYA